MPMYNTHKRYVSEVMMKEKSDISSKELAVIINITLGEAIVILTEIADEKKDIVKPVVHRKASPKSRIASCSISANDLPLVTSSSHSVSYLKS